MHDNSTDTLTSQFLSVLSSFNLTQHVDFPTHNKNDILDLVITSCDSSLGPSLSTSHWSPSDHFPIFTKLSVNSIPLLPPSYHSFRRFHSIDIDPFLCDLQSSCLITSPPTSLGSLLMAYNTTLSTLLDKHAPVITKFTTRTFKSSPCFSPTLHAFRATVRHAENLYKSTHSALDWSSFKSLCNHYHKLILLIKKQYYSHLVSSSSENPRHLWQTLNRLLHRKSSSPLPYSTSVTSLTDSFASFFTDKISRLRISLTSISPAVSPYTPSPSSTPVFLPSGRHRNLKSEDPVQLSQ